ncbi:MAG: hypothetical protein G01um10143_104 [Parcubacteria group bacterium Gr01-1014_3]|nr:MAG: hypothetical protein G01um10143_104 [Parcubacteria group bacterium Gr01-1014_3]
MNRIEIFVLAMFALVFSGSVVFAVEVLKLQDLWPLFFGGAVTLILIGAAHIGITIRVIRSRYAAARNRRARAFKSKVDADLAHESPDWFNRN